MRHFLHCDGTKARVVVSWGVDSQGEVVLGGDEGRVWVHVIWEKFIEVNVLTLGYLRAEFLWERWQSRIVFIGNNLLTGTLGRLGTNWRRERPPSWMTLGRFTPFRFCSVAVIAATFRGLAGDRRGTSASRPGASPGPECWEPTVSAINLRSWLSWPGENWEPGVREGCWWPVEWEGGSGSTETPEFLVGAGKWGAMAWGAG